MVSPLKEEKSIKTNITQHPTTSEQNKNIRIKFISSLYCEILNENDVEVCTCSVRGLDTNYRSKKKTFDLLTFTNHGKY